MLSSITLVCLLALISIILFVTEKLPADLTAFLVMVCLMLTGVLTPEEGLAGFSHVATISVFALLVLSLGLQSTGLINYVGEQLTTFTGKSEFRILFFTVIVVGFLSAFMNNTAIVAIFLPIVMRLSKYAEQSPSKFLMPLSFAAMLGGSATVIGTSTNILVSAIYEEHSGQAFNIFEFSYLGIIFFLVFTAFIFLFGRFIIPQRRSETENLVSDYALKPYLTQLIIKKGSPLIGQKLEDTDLVAHYKVRIIGLQRGNQEIWLPNHQVAFLQAGDLLTVKIRLESLLEIQGRKGIHIKRDVQLDDEELTSEETVLFEAVIGSHSFLVGKRIRDVNFREKFGALPLAFRREGVASAFHVFEEYIQFGDVLLMEARRRNLQQFYNSPDFIVLEKVKKPNFRTDRMLVALMIVVGVIVSAALNLLHIVVAALIGCALLFVTGCVSMSYIYRKMDWHIIFLLAGILPLGTAVQKVGLADLIAKYLLYWAGGLHISIIISLLFATTTLLTSFMSNNATAVLLAPIAITIAEQMGLDAKPFLVTVMFAASTSFLTPIGYQTNTLIYGVGQYTFMDFLKVGGLLTLLIWVLASILIPIFYF